MDALFFHLRRVAVFRYGIRPNKDPAAALVQATPELAAMSPARRHAMGCRGYDHVREHHGTTASDRRESERMGRRVPVLADRFEELLASLAQPCGEATGG